MCIPMRHLDLPAEHRGEVNAVLDDDVEHATRRLRALKILERQLRALRAHCISQRDGGGLWRSRATRRRPAKCRSPAPGAIRTRACRRGSRPAGHGEAVMSDSAGAWEHERINQRLGRRIEGAPCWSAGHHTSNTTQWCPTVKQALAT